MSYALRLQYAIFLFDAEILQIKVRNEKSTDYALWLKQQAHITSRIERTKYIYTF
jgi:hypothetical protein